MDNPEKHWVHKTQDEEKTKNTRLKIHLNCKTNLKCYKSS